MLTEKSTVDYDQHQPHTNTHTIEVRFRQLAVVASTEHHLGCILALDADGRLWAQNIGEESWTLKTLPKR